MEKIWECKIGGEVGDLPAGADGPMRQAVQTAFKTLTGVEASFTFSGWGATLTEGERAVHENREPNWDAMQEAIGADENEVLRATISRLRVYAEHTTGCDSWAWPGGMKKPHAKCDCGYDELMKELEETK